MLCNYHDDIKEDLFANCIDIFNTDIESYVGNPKKIKELGDFLEENENKANYKKFEVIKQSYWRSYKKCILDTS